MFVLRLLALLALTAFCFGMGTIPANEANAVAKVFAPLFFVAAPALYFLPTLEAYLRGHNNLGALAALNLLAGWTLIGWVGALVWALAKPARVEPEQPSWTLSPQPSIAPRATLSPKVEEKTCPFCAETIRAAAIVCKHCGRDLATPAGEST